MLITFEKIATLSFGLMCALVGLVVGYIMGKFLSEPFNSIYIVRCNLKQTFSFAYPGTNHGFHSALISVARLKMKAETQGLTLKQRDIDILRWEDNKSHWITISEYGIKRKAIPE